MRKKFLWAYIGLMLCCVTTPGQSGPSKGALRAAREEGYNAGAAATKAAPSKDASASAAQERGGTLVLWLVEHQPLPVESNSEKFSLLVWELKHPRLAALRNCMRRCGDTLRGRCKPTAQTSEAKNAQAAGRGEACTSNTPTRWGLTASDWGCPTNDPLADDPLKRRFDTRSWEMELELPPSAGERAGMSETTGLLGLPDVRQHPVPDPGFWEYVVQGTMGVLFSLEESVLFDRLVGVTLHGKGNVDHNYSWAPIPYHASRETLLTAIRFGKKVESERLVVLFARKDGRVTPGTVPSGVEEVFASYLTSLRQRREYIYCIERSITDTERDDDRTGRHSLSGRREEERSRCSVQ